MNSRLQFYYSLVVVLGFIGVAPSVSAGAAYAQEVGKLYAPKPPKGSAFVRVVSGLDGVASVQLGSLSPVELKAGERNATNFRLLKGGGGRKKFRSMAAGWMAR